MTVIARKSDGRRIFTAGYKREQIGRVLRGDLTLAGLSRKLGIARGVLQRWKRLETDRTGSAPMKAGVAVSAMSAGTNEQQIAVLQRLVGRQTVELDSLRAELDALNTRRRL